MCRTVLGPYKITNQNLICNRQKKQKQVLLGIDTESLDAVLISQICNNAQSFGAIIGKYLNEHTGSDPFIWYAGIFICWIT